MLKAYREVPKVQEQAVRREMTEWDRQVQEFGEYIKKEHADKPYNSFIANMYLRLIVKEEALSDKMVQALRRNLGKAPEESTEAATPKTITLKVRQWLMKDLGIDSRVITGEVLRETSKAYLLKGHADMLVDATFCMRCGRPLTEPASIVTGVGAVCADKMGIPYDSDGVLRMTKRERSKIRKQYIKVLHNQTFERWIPKSQVEEIVTDPAEAL